MVFVIGIMFFTKHVYAQDNIENTMSFPDSVKRNIIRWNLTPMMVNITNVTFGYERILSNNRSFSMNAGLLLFPRFLNNDSLEISYVKHGSRLGFTTAADYRIYLTKKNLNPAPEGVYIGPYISYYQYSFDSELRVVDNEDVINDIGVDATFKMFSLGFELGYQFLFWDKMTLDLIMVGPSITYYYAHIDLTGSLGIDEDSDIYEYVENQVFEKYPWIEHFASANAINTGGSFDKFGMGFRYVIQIGYHF